jgi:hypothetical protein
MKILPVRAELFCVNGEAYEQSERYTDGQTDRRNAANSRFSQFCESA